MREVSPWSRLWGSLVDLCPPLGSREVLKRSGVTLIFIALLRLGSFIPLRGVNLARLSAVPRKPSVTSTWHAASVDCNTPNHRVALAAATDPRSAFFGVASGVPAHIFLLGITPIFTASILVALMQRFPGLLGSKVKRGEEVSPSPLS